MNGRKPSTPSSENWNGDACRPTAASHGSASCDPGEPTSLIDGPVQSLRKSGCDQRPPLGLRIFGSPIQGDREAVRLPGRVVDRLELLDQLVETAVEAARIGVVEPNAEDAGAGGGVLLVDRQDLLGSDAE